MKNKTEKKYIKGNTTVWVVIAVLIVAIVGVIYMFSTQPTYDEAAMTQSPALVGDEAPNDIEYVDEEISESPDQGTTASDVLSNPEQYEGQRVQLRAEVEEWVASRAFVLDAQGVVADNLLVITDTPQLIFEDPEIFGDAIWEVNGTVDRFQVTVMEDLDLDFDAELVTTYEGKPYIVADSVELFEE